jgi:hypothetical protein
MTAERRRLLRMAFWAWTIIASAAATAGGVIGWIGIDNDRT